MVSFAQHTALALDMEILHVNLSVVDHNGKRVEDFNPLALVLAQQRAVGCRGAEEMGKSSQ